MIGDGAAVMGATKGLKTHKDLDVWQKGLDLAEDICHITQNFPVNERNVLTAQLRRAAISVPSNIAEGAARNSKKEFVQYLYIALGSLSELETQLYLSQRLGYISNDDKIFEDIDQVRRMLLGLIKFTKGKKNE